MNDPVERDNELYGWNMDLSYLKLVSIGNEINRSFCSVGSERQRREPEK